MAVSKVELIAYMEDGRELAVVADQRDFAKWEVQPYDDVSVTRLRFLAWSAAYRQQVYKGAWTEFNELDCVEVGTPDDAVKESKSLDPGSPETPDTD